MIVFSDKFMILSKKVVFTLLVIASIYPFLPGFMRITENKVAILAIILYAIHIFRKIILKQKIVIDGIVIFFIYYLVHTFFTHKFPWKAGFQAYGLFLTPLYLLAFYVLYAQNKNRELVLYGVKVLVWMGVFQSLTGFSQVLFNYPIPELVETDPKTKELVLHSSNRNYFALLGAAQETNQASGSFSHFNELAPFLLICACLAYALWFYYRTLLWQIVFFIIFSGIIVTFSRGALMSTLTALMIMYFAYTNYRTVKLLAFSVAFVLFFFVTAPALKTYADQTGNHVGRYTTWVYCWEIAKQQPEKLFFGYGIWYFRTNYLSSDMIHLTEHEQIIENMHNTPLQLLLELGIIGSLILYVSLIGLIVLAVKKGNIWSFCLISIIWGFYFSQVFDQAFFGYDGTIYFTAIGLLVGLMRYDNSSTNETHLTNQNKLSKSKKRENLVLENA